MIRLLASSASRALLVTSAIAAFCPLSALGANILSDPGFELVDVTNCNSGNLFSTNLPWFTEPVPSPLGSPDVFSYDCATLPGADPVELEIITLASAHGGLRMLGAGSLAGVVRESVAQTLGVPLIEGGSYLLTGYFARAENQFDGPGGYDVLLTSISGVAGTIVGSIGVGAVAGSWTFDSLEFTAPTNANVLVMTCQGFPNEATYVACDDLVLELVEPTPVEPSSWGRLKRLFR